MVGILESVFLGIVQGITEWLPVSSKGNVAILAQFLGLQTKEAFSYAIILHVGTLIAAAVYFRKEILELLKGKEKQTLKFIFWTLVFTAVTAIPSYFVLKKVLETASFQVLGLTFYSQTIFMLVVGIFLLITGFLQLAKKKAKTAETSGKNAAFLGLGQGLTVLPGLSRSGTTTSIMLFEGFSPEKAFHLSFLISVPAVLLGELSFNLLEKPALGSEMLFGIIAAAIAGFLTIDALLKVAKKINFGKFCIALALVYFFIAGVSIILPAIA
ncbi:undecaprenyl-diphosphate phosphatase [archaeon]|nr:undecaprenyl-diphosphate phosphatase [archaeon]